MIFRDLNRRQILTGDYVIYAHRTDYDCPFRIGKVIEKYEDHLVIDPVERSGNQYVKLRRSKVGPVNSEKFMVVPEQLIHPEAIKEINKPKVFREKKVKKINTRRYIIKEEDINETK